MLRSLLFTTLLLLPAALRAEDGDAKPLWKSAVRGTIGSGKYIGRGATLQYGDLWRVKGSYSDYRFNGSTGTTRTASVRGAYQGENLSAGITLSLTPRNNSYANRSFGADGAWTFVFDDGDGDGPGGLEEMEFGGWWTQTRHSQIVPATPVLPTERTIIINQHDIGMSASATAWNFTLSIDGYRSLYDQDFSQLPAAVRLRPRLAETASLVNSFPDRGGSARIEWSHWRAFVPYISAAATHYSIQPQPAALTCGMGAAMKYGNFGLDLGYELTRQKGAGDTKYFNFGVSAKF